ncbi:MAG: fibronectin type III domain-containing protein [Bacteroidales bacterium]|nr:fibronectin type III domain-containing protein [Bacteroidales bacterium]
MLLLLMTAIGAVAQETLTVYDGTETSSYVPMYVGYFDDFTRTQYVIPAEDLVDMENGQITAIKYYTSLTTAYTTASTVDFYITEVDNASISAFIDKASATMIYQGTLDFVLVGDKCELTITFATPYTYNGGNLLIGCENTTDAGYSFVYFYGQTVTGASVGGYNSSSLSSVTPTQRNFIPKTTFTYTPVVASCPRVNNLSANNLTSSSADITWEAGGSETAWVLKYGPAGFNVETEGTTQNISTTPAFEITGLSANTAYDVYVKAVCGGGDESTWRKVSFRTACGAIASFPWSENFESYESGNFTEPCWVNEHISGSGSQIFKIYTYSNGNNSTHQLQLPDMSNGTLTKLVLPAFNFGGVAHQFVLDVFRNVSGTSYTSEGIRIYASADGEIEGATELGFVYRNYQQTDGNVVPAESASGWYTYEFNIPLTGTCYIILRGESQYGSATYMDNFIVREVPTCIKPTALAASGITSTSATLDWSAGASETAWVLKYGPAGFNVETEGTAQDVSSNPSFEITGLDANTSYDVYVKSNCGGGDESEWIQTSFRTECGIESIPWSENFDSQSAGVVPTCWTKVGSGSALVNNGNANSGSNSLKFSGVAGGNIIALPQFGSEISGLQLSFYTRPENTTNSSCGTFEVGYITDLTDASTFVPVESYAYNDWASATHTQKDVVMSSAPAGSYFAFNHKANSTYYYWFVDDVSVDLAPSCVKPTALTVSNITARTATISWVAGAGETAWQISLQDDEDDLINVTDTTYTLTGLVPESDYTVKVRTICGEGEFSDWTSNSTFTTLPSCLVPENMVAEVTAHTATLSWTAVGGEALWNLQYKAATDTVWTEVNGLDVATYTITGLDPASPYIARVQADCDLDGESSWLSKVFSTGYAVPFLEEFPTSTIPTSWSRYSGLLSDVMEGTALSSGTYGWTISSVNGVMDDGYHAKVNIYGTSCRYWLVTPSIEMDANVQLTFDLALTDYSNANPIEDPTAQADDKFVVLVSTDNGSTWTVLRQYDNAGSEYVYNSIATAGEEVVINLSDYSTGNVKIAFYAESTVGSNGDNDLRVDNVRLDYIPVVNYTITATAGENGTITPAEVTVEAGEDAVFTITPDAGYRIAAVVVDADTENEANVTNDVVAGDEAFFYTFTNVTANHTINVTFELIPTYTITVNAGENGYVYYNDALVAEPIVVTEGATPAFEITPATNYQIAVLTVDGNAIDLTSVQLGGYTYTFEPVMANHTLAVTFEAIPATTYTITATAGEHGTISPEGAVSVTEGGEQAFVITPDTDYRIDVLTVDGEAVTLNDAEILGYTYTFTDVVANHTIDVTFTSLNAADMIEAASMAIYPNPNNGMFSIDFSNIEGDATYEIIDARGAVVETRNINVTNGETMNFNHNLNAGTYFVRIIAADKVYVEQIVVE